MSILRFFNVKNTKDNNHEHLLGMCIEICETTACQITSDGKDSSELDKCIEILRKIHMEAQDVS